MTVSHRFDTRAKDALDKQREKFVQDIISLNPTDFENPDNFNKELLRRASILRLHAGFTSQMLAQTLASKNGRNNQ